MHKLARSLTMAGVVLVSCAIARADGVDIVWLLARAGPAKNPLAAIAIVIASMLVNYALNYAVIGRPVVKAGLVGKRDMAGELVLFTFWGQLADRAAIVPAGFLDELVVRPLIGWHGLVADVLAMLAINFVLSALTIGALALFFLRRRWKVSPRPAWKIAGWAALITNPAWAMALWLL